MAGETLGASFSIDVTNLKAGLAQANRLIRESESEFKAAAAGMDDWSKSEEGLESRLKHLNTAADLQRQKVDALQSEYDQLIANGLDPTSAQATELRTKINKETEALNKNESEIRKQTAALAGMKGESSEAMSAADALRQKVQQQTSKLDDLKEKYLNVVLAQGKSSKEAKALKSEIGALSEELDENKSALEQTADAAEDAGDGFGVAEGALSTFIGNGLLMLVDAAKNAISSFFGLAESTREYRTTMASLENSSKAAGYSAAETEATFKQLNGVLGDTQGAATTTANLQAIGLEQSKLQELTDGVIGAWARYGDSIPIDGLAEAVNHTVQLGEVQGNLADVIEWGGGNVDEFNEQLAKCTTEAERAELIQKMLAEQGLTESGKAWQENNASIVEANNAQAEYDATTAELGKKIEPLTNKFLELKTKGMQWLIDKGLPAVESGFAWIKDNIPTVAMLIGTLTTAWLTFGGAQKIVDMWNKLTTASQTALNTAMNANPIGLIVLAITTLVTAFMLLWENCEGFRNFWIGLWDGIKNAVGVVVDWIKENWQAMLLFIMNPLAGVFKYCYDHFEGFRNFVDGVVQSVRDFFVNLWENIKNVFSTIATWFNANVIQPIWNFIYPFVHNAQVLITGTWELIKAVFSIVAAWFNDNVIQPVANFFTGLWEGLKNGATAAWDFVSGVFSVVSTWFNDNIIKPVGDFFVGMWDGLKNGAKNAWDGIKNTFSSVATFFGDIFKKAWQKVKDIFSVGGKIFDGIKDGIANAFKTVVNAIIRGINKVVSVPFNAINKVLDKVKNVEIAKIKPFSGLISTINVPAIPELATGGVVTKATTAVVGEDGAEAIMPLENNTGWIKKLAQEIAAEQGQGVVINQTNNYKQATTSRKEKYKAKQELFAAARLIKAGAY